MLATLWRLEPIAARAGRDYTSPHRLIFPRNRPSHGTANLDSALETSRSKTLERPMRFREADVRSRLVVLVRHCLGRGSPANGLERSRDARCGMPL